MKYGHFCLVSSLSMSLNFIRIIACIRNLFFLYCYCISLYDCATGCLSTFLLIYIWVIPSLGILWKHSFWIFCTNGHFFKFLLREYMGLVLQSQRVPASFVLSDITRPLIPSGCRWFTFWKNCLLMLVINWCGSHLKFDNENTLRLPHTLSFQLPSLQWVSKCSYFLCLRYSYTSTSLQEAHTVCIQFYTLLSETF